MITQAAQVKCFPLSQKQVLISGPCLQTLAHISYFLPPCLLCPSLSLLPEGLLFTAECLPLNGRCDRTHHNMGFKGEGDWGLRACHCRRDQNVPPNLTTEWFMRWNARGVGRGGEVCVWLHRCCVWASLVSAVFLTLTRKRDVGGEGGGSVCVVGE